MSFSFRKIAFVVYRKNIKKVAIFTIQRTMAKKTSKKLANNVELCKNLLKNVRMLTLALETFAQSEVVNTLRERQ
jgi:hypothetical protein